MTPEERLRDLAVRHAAFAWLDSRRAAGKETFSQEDTSNLRLAGETVRPSRPAFRAPASRLAPTLQASSASVVRREAPSAARATGAHSRVPSSAITAACALSPEGKLAYPKYRRMLITGVGLLAAWLLVQYLAIILI